MPVGTTVRGAGPQSDPVILGDTDPGDPSQWIRLVLRTGACGVTRLEDVRLQAPFGAVVTNDGDGELAIARTTVEMTWDDETFRPPPVVSGIVLNDVRALLEDVTIVRAIDAGLEILGGQARVDGLRIREGRNCRHISCSVQLSPTGVVVAEGGELTGTDIEITDMRGFGLRLHNDGSRAELSQVTIRSGSRSCIFMNQGADLTLTDAELEECGGVAVLAGSTTSLALSDVRIGPTNSLNLTCGESCSCRANGGIALHLGGDGNPSGLTLSDVLITTSGDEDAFPYGIGLVGPPGAEDRARIEDVEVRGDNGVSLTLAGGLSRSPEWDIRSDLPESPPASEPVGPDDALPISDPHPCPWPLRTQDPG